MGVNRVVILGASGFVGSAVLRAFAARPGQVRAVARRPVPVPAATVADVEVLTTDLTEPGAMAAAIDGADLVVHAVAYIAGASTWRVGAGDTAAERINAGLAEDLAAAAPPGLRVVYTGSTVQAGIPRAEVIDGSEPDEPAGEYGRHKLRAEGALLAGELTATSVRLPTVFGYAPDSTAKDRGVVSSMIRRALAGEPLTMWHDGTVRRDLVYIGDVAAAICAAADHIDELAGRHWLLGTGVGAPLGEVFRTVADLAGAHTGVTVPVVSVPPPDYADPNDFRSVTVDASAFRAVTGWAPAVSRDEALRRTVDFVAAGREAQVMVPA